MKGYIDINSSNELHIKWTKETFQKIDFYLPSEHYSDKIDSTCIESDRDSLISLSWYGYGPGTGSSMAIDSLTLESGERLYFCVTDFKRPQLLGLVKDTSNWNIDHSFLQRLLGSNGNAFNTQIFKVPADGISIHVNATWDFIVDIILQAFNSANCWDALFGKFPNVWNETYEKPKSKLLMPDDFVNDIKLKLKEEFESTYKKPRTWMEAIGFGHNHRKFISDNFDKYLEESTPVFRFHSVPLKNEWKTPENKWRIVERYLNQVLSENNGISS